MTKQLVVSLVAGFVTGSFVGYLLGLGTIVSANPVLVDIISISCCGVACAAGAGLYVHRHPNDKS